MPAIPAFGTELVRNRVDYQGFGWLYTFSIHLPIKRMEVLMAAISRPFSSGKISVL